MRRTLIVIALVVSLCTLVRPWSAEAAVNHTATCVITNYTLTGSFNRLGGATSFHLHAVGGCTGTSTGVTVDLDYNSVGSWSCDAGAAHGGGFITPNNGPTILVDSYLVNIGGEYVVEVHNTSAGTVAAGQFTTLPVSCDLGTTQTTIPGTGTLTFTA